MSKLMYYCLLKQKYPAGYEYARQIQGESMYYSHQGSALAGMFLTIVAMWFAPFLEDADYIPRPIGGIISLLGMLVCGGFGLWFVTVPKPTEDQEDQHEGEADVMEGRGNTPVPLGQISLWTWFKVILGLGIPSALVVVHAYLNPGSMAVR